MSDTKRYTVAVDFDGVLHSYSSPWIAAHVIPDPPVADAIRWLHRTMQGFEIVILTTRGKSWRGRRAVKRWIREHAGALWTDGVATRGLHRLTVSATKEAALIYIDDRAHRFDGQNFPTHAQIHAARPWNKPHSRMTHPDPVPPPSVEP